MKALTFTAGGLLLATALLAFDMAAVELVRRERSWWLGNAWLLVVVLPTVNAMALGLYRFRRQLAIIGEASPFLVGFQAAGWTAVAAVLVYELGFPEPVSWYQRWAEARLGEFWHEYIEWDGGFSRLHRDGIAIGFRVFAMAAPQLLLALLGGWAAACLGVVVVKGPPSTGRLRSISARRATAALAVLAVVLAAAVWGARVRGRWLVYRDWADRAAGGEVHYRREYERALARVRSLDEGPGQFAGDAAARARYRGELVDYGEMQRRWMEWCAAVRALYEPAARRPWLPIPPNPPLSPHEVVKTPTGPIYSPPAG